MVLKLYDKNHTYLGIIQKRKDLKRESRTSSGDKSMSFVLLESEIEILPEYYIRDDVDEYVVKEIDSTTSAFPTIYAALNLEELEGKAWKTFSASDATISEAAQLAIAGTGWRVAGSTVTKRRNAGIMKKSTLGVLEDLCTAFLCEMVYDTINKTITFTETRGSDRGVYFLAGLNLQQLTSKKDTYDFYTRIIPYGADDLDIRSVNGGVEYIDNTQYSSKVRTYIWEDSNYTDAQALKDDAAAKLADMSKPKISYQASVFDLAKMSETYSLLDFNLGDTITLIDESTGTRDKQRIIKLTEYPDEPERNTCELSNTSLTWEEMQSKLKAAAAIVDVVIGSDGNYNGTIKVSDILHFSDGIVGTSGGSGVTLGSFFQTTTGTLGEMTLQIGSIEVNMLTADEAALTYATIQNLNAASARISTLEATALTAEYADLHYAAIESLTAVSARVGTLEANSVTTEYANAHFAAVDLANVENGSITTAMIGQGVVGTEQIADASITSAKIVALDAGKITTGTLDASNLNVVNLNAASITVGTINGQQLSDGIISMDKLASDVSDEIDGAVTTAEEAKEAADAAITETVRQYTVTQTTAPPGAGASWSTATPAWAEGSYIWERTLTTYGSGSTVTSSPVLLTGNTGEDAVLLRLDSSAGVMFKNNNVNTVLSVTIFKGSRIITDANTLHDVFGAGAYIQWTWRRLDDERYGIISADDSRIYDGGFKFRLSPDDVDTKVTFQCTLMI